MCQRDGVRHILFRLVSGITEHHTLIACADGLDLGIRHLILFCFQSLVHAHCDIGRLLVDGHQHGTGIAVKSVLGLGVANLFYSLTYNFLHINICICGNFACHQNESCAACRLTCHTAHRIFFHARIQDGIGNGIADFVGMAFCY